MLSVWRADKKQLASDLVAARRDAASKEQLALLVSQARDQVRKSNVQVRTALRQAKAAESKLQQRLGAGQTPPATAPGGVPGAVGH